MSDENLYKPLNKQDNRQSNSISSPDKWIRRNPILLVLGTVMLLQIYIIVGLKSSSKVDENQMTPLLSSVHHPKKRHPQYLDCGTPDQHQDSGDHFVTTKTNPSYIMNIHDPNVDKALSGVIAKHGSFEGGTLSRLIDALHEAGPDSLFIDIGANIGMYTLTALANQHDTISFEPFKKNYDRLCKSVRANGFQDRLSLFHAAVVENGPQVVSFGPPVEHNPGGTQVRPAANGAVTSGNEGVDFAVGVTIDSIANASLLPVHRPVVMKLDIEGGECKALSGGLKYFQNVDLRYVQMEVTGEHPFHDCEKIGEVIGMLLSKGLKPYMNSVMPQESEYLLDSHDWNTWFKPGFVIGDIIWR